MTNQPTPLTHYAIQERRLPPIQTHIKRKFLNIPYASLSPSQKLDVYLPDEGEGPFPVIMAFHGGAFMGCDKADLQVLPMLEGFKRGYAVVSCNYRMSGEAKFPALVQDAKAAVRWVRANARQYSFDPQRIAAWGGSAGGYLSTMLGTSAGIIGLEDLSLGNPDQPCNVQAVVAWYGPTNFLKMDEHLGGERVAAPAGIPSQRTKLPRIPAHGADHHRGPGKGKSRQPGDVYPPRRAALPAPTWYKGCDCACPAIH